MNGMLSQMNWSSLIEKPLETSMRKYALRRNESEVIFSNSNCSIKFWDSDYQAFNWVFFDPNAKHVYFYDVSKYATYVLDRKIPRWTNPNKVDTLEQFTIETFKYYNDIILNYLDKPLSGDYKWHEKYIKAYKIQLKLTNYAYSTTSAHSEERRGVTRSFRRNEEGSKNALIEYLSENYPDEGKEFDVLHQDNSVHQLMVKYQLKVPFYFSYNNELYKVVKRNEENDFGQIYRFLKYNNTFITPIRCSFAIQSNYERIEILTENEFEERIKERLANNG